ncbi:MAG TPA: tRNA lysidine(34) synthetase TilS [Puia sp.]|nr:tRNA lysidine(34) synthetase TilS [Puia sp.]
MDNFISRFQASVKKQHLFNQSDKLLLAVSGGLDSVVLAACCFESGYDFAIAHANFQMRGQESERDEQFVKALADRYQKPVRIRKFDTTGYADQHAVSIQVAARDLRYPWFESLLEKENYRYLLTAHHLDDNIETMLMHFFRGTGIAGLRGMLPIQGNIIRPLLTFSRSEIKKFAAENALSWVEDSSNASEKYTRNYFRRKLIPEVETVFPETRHSLKENLQRFAETEILYLQAIEQHKRKLLKPMGAEMHVPVLLLKKSRPIRSILYEIIRYYGFSPAQIDDCLKLLDAENGKYTASDTHRIIRNRAWLIIAPVQESLAAHVVIEADQPTVNFPEGKLLLKTVQDGGNTEISKDPALAWLDAGKINYPLLLRKWRAGDYFYPLGMKKKKKIARFLIDQKLSKTAKEKVWVLESDQRIIWVAGHRIDNRFCATPSTKKILKIEMRMPQFV